MGTEKKQRNIVMLGHKRIPSREGGVEIVVEELSTRMAAAGHKVTCLNRAGSHVSGKTFNAEKLKEYKGVQIKTVLTLDKKGLAAMTASVTGAVAAAFGRYDVVHFHAEGPCAMLWLPKLFGKRCIATIHGLDHQRAKWGRLARTYIMLGEKCAAKHADEIIVLSRGVQQYFRDTYGRETVFIPNGVSEPEIKEAVQITESYGLKKDAYLLFLGRLVPEKGITYLIDAFRQVKTDKKLVIAGGSSDTNEFADALKAQAAGDDRILFTGFVQGRPLEELYSNAYLYVLPSDLEGMPLSLLEDGMNCGTFATDKPQVLTHTVWGRECTDTVTFLCSANIPSMHIDTKSGSMEYIHEKKGNEEPGELRLYSEHGALDYTGSVESIEGRGNVTWTNREKKPYSMTLVEEADLIGLGKAKEWILLANAFDASNLRNQIVYQFAKAIGLPFSPDSTWVDVYLNGEYAGLYLLCERNEIHPERVAISETGSFLVSLELEERLASQNYTYITTDAKQALRIHYPQDASNESLTELTAKWQAIENALLAEDGIDPVTGKSWDAQIDLDSWARKYLIEELFGSIDACLISQYFYKDGADKQDVVYAGPVWDFDNAIGNRNSWELENPVSFQATHPHDRNGLTAPWFYEFYQKESFYNRVVKLYKSEFQPELNRLLEYGIAEYAAHIQQAACMNEVRWFENSTGFYEEVEYILDYMSARIEFFTNLWCENVEYALVKVDYGHDCWYAVPVGEKLTVIHEFEDTEYAVFRGWYYSDTDEPFDPETPITEDIEIYAKWVEKSEKKMKQLAKLAPLGVIAVIGVGLLWVEMKRWKKSR